MNAHATQRKTTRASGSNDFASRTASSAEMRTRPRRVATLLVVRDKASAADGPADASGAHSSSHWVAVAPEPHAGKRVPGHVEALAQQLGVGTGVAWEVLDGMFGSANG
jgi:hypothetical protein